MEKMIELYNDFVEKMNKGLATAQEAAECQARIVQLYPNIARRVRDASKAVNAEERRLLESVDPTTNKPMTAAKAEKTVGGGNLGEELLNAKCDADIYENFKYTLKDYMESLNKEWVNT